jgi:hypothetical protein
MEAGDIPHSTQGTVLDSDNVTNSSNEMAAARAIVLSLNTKHRVSTRRKTLEVPIPDFIAVSVHNEEPVVIGKHAGNTASNNTGKSRKV